MKKTTAFILLLAATLSSQAQTQFFGKVKIDYEKTVNVLATYKEAMEPQWFDRIKERLPKDVITYHEFIGDTSRSLYRPGKESNLDPRTFYRPIADKNVVYTDFATGKTVTQKPVFEETFLVEDSLSRIKWKLTSDTRVIAGYECRKAIGILDDSIGVFAFYTDEILIPGGPEGVQGLPGMILGMGIPRLHATWFATKVDVFDINMKPVLPATKGRKTTKSAMMQSLDKIMKEWGPYGSKMIANFAI